MWYIKSDLEKHDASELKSEFNVSLPYSKRLKIEENTILQLVDLRFIRNNSYYLLYNPSTATWCYIDDQENKICQSILHPRTGSYLIDNFRGYGTKRLKRFLTDLYKLGLLTVNNIEGIDSDIYTNGPLYTKSYLIELLMTEKCNLACKHCFSKADMSRASMPLEIGYLTIDKAMELPSENLKIEFAGGETYVEFNKFNELVKYIKRKARQKGKTVQIMAQSNGTMFHEHRISRFIDKHQLNPAISFDGPPDINDKIRSFPDGCGSTDLIIKGIGRLRRYGFKSIPILTVVNRLNVNQPEKLIDYFISLGISYGMFNPILPLGRAKDNWNELGISPEEYFRFMKRFLEYSTTQNNSFKDLNTCRFIENLIKRTREFRCMRSPCGAGYDYIVISPNGDIYPCAHHVDKPELKMGNIKDDELLNSYILHNPLVAEMRLYRIVSNIPECRKCIWRHLCEAGCSLDTYFEYGTFYHSANLCKFYKLMYPYLLNFLFRHPEVAKRYLHEARVVSY